MADRMEFPNTMKEFIEKLIGRLEEERKRWTDNIDFLEQTQEYQDRRIAVAKSQGYSGAYFNSIEIVNQLAEEYINTSTDTSSGWVAFTQRELDEEEKEHYGNEIKYMLDCKLPEEDEEILVTYKWKDEFYVDNDTFLRDGSECYLDSGIELITEAIAWMPLPAPYKEGVTENE